MEPVRDGLPEDGPQVPPQQNKFIYLQMGTPPSTEFVLNALCTLL